LPWVASGAAAYLNIRPGGGWSRCRIRSARARDRVEWAAGGTGTQNLKRPRRAPPVASAGLAFACLSAPGRTGRCPAIRVLTRCGRQRRPDRWRLGRRPVLPRRVGQGRQTPRAARPWRRVRRRPSVRPGWRSLSNCHRPSPSPPHRRVPRCCPIRRVFISWRQGGRQPPPTGRLRLPGRSLSRMITAICVVPLVHTGVPRAGPSRP
jgi:hypothetical protein